MPYGVRKFARFAVNVWDISPDGKNEEELAKEGLSAMEAVSYTHLRLKELYNSLGLAMTFKDFLHIQKYFQGEEKRDPSMTEIRVCLLYTSRCV